MTFRPRMLTMIAPRESDDCHPPGPVTITHPDGTSVTMAADEFRRSRGAAQCLRCFLWFSSERLRRHRCRYVNPYPPASAPTGVDARVSTRAPARAYRALGDEGDD